MLWPFKMLGVSLHALQLTNMLPNHIFSNFPTIDWAGIYPSWEVVACQMLFIFIIVIVTVKQHENEDRRLTIVEHLSEFRRRFIACILCFSLSFVEPSCFLISFIPT